MFRNAQNEVTEDAKLLSPPSPEQSTVRDSCPVPHNRPSQSYVMIAAAGSYKATLPALAEHATRMGHLHLFLHFNKEALVDDKRCMGQRLEAAGLQQHAVVVAKTIHALTPGVFGARKCCFKRSSARG